MGIPVPVASGGGPVAAGAVVGNELGVGVVAAPGAAEGVVTGGAAGGWE